LYAPGWSLSGPAGAGHGRGALADLAASLLLSHARVLQDDRNGLFSHGFDDASDQPNGIFWGRARGWALLGLGDTLQALPGNHPARLEIAQRGRALAAGLRSTEAEPGCWHTVVDAPWTYVEHYAQRGRGVFPWGQGAALLALQRTAGREYA